MIDVNRLTDFELQTLCYAVSMYEGETYFPDQSEEQRVNDIYNKLKLEKTRRELK
jgi:hypothetical protein